MNRLRYESLSPKAWAVSMIALLLTSFVVPTVEAQDSPSRTDKVTEAPFAPTMKLTFAECLDSAFHWNRYRPAAQEGLHIAEAQLKQARSGHWPQISAQLSAVRFDQDPNYIMPPSSLSLNVPVLGMMAVDVPAQEVILMDKLNGLAKAEFVFPVYTGGKVSSIVRQAEAAVDMAHAEVRKTDAQICRDVTRTYYGCVLARNLERIGHTALERLETTLALTENLYQKGSGKVKKTDYLKNRMIVETVRSLIQTAEQNVKSAGSALIHAMGVSWAQEIDVSEDEIPFQPDSVDVDRLIDEVLASNPDVARVNSGLMALEAKRDEARSGYFPQVAVIGNILHIENKWDYGQVTKNNKDSWMIGIGVQMELFSGFRTSGQVEEATARRNKLHQESELLRSGLTLQVRYLANQLEAARLRVLSTRKAMESAAENRELTERAYESELMEVKDLVESQIMESVAEAQYQKARYDYVETRARLESLSGSMSCNNYNE